MKPRTNEFDGSGERKTVHFRPHAHRGAALLAVGLALLSALATLPHPARGDSGGPDQYGYTWVDSTFPNPGVAFSWIDGVAGGTDLLLTDDGCGTGPVSFGFQFRFYGILYSSAWVCANGFLAFNTPAGFPQFTDDFVAALGADLNPDPMYAPGTGHVFAKADTFSSPRQFILTWDGTYTYGTTQRQTFEIVLIENPTGEDGRILLQYKDLTNPPGHLTGIANIGYTSSLYYTGNLTDQLALMFLPPGSVPPGDVVTVRGTNLAPASVEPGQSNVPMLRLNLTTLTGSISLRRIRVDVTGQVSVPGDVSLVSLWRDADRDGVFNTANDALLVAGTPAGLPEQALLTLPAPLSIPAGPGENLFVAIDVPLTAAVGDWIGGGVLGAPYVTVDPPDTVSNSNFPINSYIANTRTRIVEGVDTLRVISWSATNPANVTRWQTDVPMLAITVDVDKGAVTIDRVAVLFLGTRSTDVYLGKLFEDADGDLVLRPGADRLLGRGGFGGGNTVNLPASLQVVAGSPRTLWIAFDISPTAILTDLVGARVPNAGAVTVVGTKDLVAPDLFPVETPTLSVVRAGGPPEIVSRWAVRAPDPDGSTYRGEYLVSPQNARDLGALGGNEVGAWLIVENDADTLYVAYDSVGDRTAGPGDLAALSFRTNRSAFPLAPPDDQFGVGGPMGPYHAVFNETSLRWQVEDACNATLDSNHSRLACAAGFGPSGADAVPHRIYEFRIPLSLLEVPMPIPPDYRLELAALSNWSQGVWDADTGRNASWPFAAPPIPPTWYGILRLTNAAPANNPPVLGWTGEIGFETDGLDPESGTTDTLFVFRVLYTDRDGDGPSLGEPELHVLSGPAEISGSPFTMTAAFPSDTNVTDGKVFSQGIVFTGCPRAFSYFITAQDDRGADAVPTPTLPGPTVACPPEAPTLTNGTVSPASGFVDTAFFTWSVEYRDGNGDAPALVQLTILKGGTPVANRSMTRTTWLGDPGNYSRGAMYEASSNLSVPGGDYSYAFLANDSLLETSTPPSAGPTVLPEPADLLLVGFADEAPVIADQGARGVKMFTAILQADNAYVDVNSLRMDRAGASLDSDVSLVRLYHDVDRDGAITGPDILLAQGPFASGSVTFAGFFVRVTAGTPEHLVAYVDVAPNAVADERVGLRIVDAGYVGVARPDVVAPFASFQSTRFGVNAAPAATGLTADGHANNTPDVLHLATATPTLGWSFTDANFNDVVQGAYNVTVYAEPSGARLWWSNGTGATSSVVYAGPSLARGATYRMDVRVSDGRLWGPVASLWFRLNTPPPAPALVDPTDNQTGLGPTSVTLRWDAVTDPEGDVVSYRWALSTTPDLAAPLEGTTTSVSAIVTTAGSTTYYWRVTASDQREQGPPSDVRSFTTRPTAGTIRGWVNETGRTDVHPLSVVRLFNATGDFVAQTTTNPQTGGFILPAVPFGSYSVNVSSQGYVGKEVRPIDVTLAAPNVYLSVELDPVATTGPDGTAGPDLLTILTWIAVGIVAALAVTVPALLAVRRRRRNGKAPAAREAAAPAGPSATAGEPGPMTDSVGPEAGEEPLYACPACGTSVSVDATSCQGCGALFED